MSLLICAPTVKELLALAPGVFPRPSAMPELSPMRAPIKNGDALFLVTGIGPINTALAFGLTFGLTHESVGSNVRIRGIILAGLAGAFDLQEYPLRSIWQIGEEIWPEYGLNDGLSVTARAFRHAQWEKTPGPVYERISLTPVDAIPDINPKKDVDWGVCSSLTVAGVTASFARRQALWDAWHVPLENMEGFAAAYGAARAEIPMAEIRVVSNKVGPRGRGEKDFDGALEALGDILPALNLL